MPIRDVTGNVTGGIGPIRYVENGKTVNIPIAYVVENGRTVLVYKETIDASVYTPTGDTYYLYNRGTISEALGSFVASDSINTTYKATAGYLSLTTPKNANMRITLKNTRPMNLTEYKHLYLEYEYLNASTGAKATSSLPYRYTLSDSSGNGKFQYMFITNDEYIGSDSGFWAETFLEISADHDYISTTEDIELRIYSIYITKA
jgi:hypothetical protein